MPAPSEDCVFRVSKIQPLLSISLTNIGTRYKEPTTLSPLRRKQSRGDVVGVRASTTICATHREITKLWKIWKKLLDSMRFIKVC